MLQRLGIPLSLETQEHVTLNLELQSNQTELSQLRELSKDLSAEVEKLRSCYVCQICCSNDVSKLLVPCGHLLCASCCSNIASRKCPFCRTKFSSTTNFFKPT